ncbi:hypothetical protein PROPHIBWHA1_41 [Mycobacterium phage prophiBWHA-1]|nr:hypothetical protein PROPHIBWHA1_41 [Mycobacterium phage prophiBWHA-1]
MKKPKPIRLTETLGKFGKAYVNIEWVDYKNVDSCTVTKMDGTVVAEGVTTDEGRKIAREVMHKEFQKDLGIGGGALTAALEQGLKIGKGSPGGLTEIWNIKPVDEE